MTTSPQVRYGGFWRRFAANFLDNLIISVAGIAVIFALRALGILEASDNPEMQPKDMLAMLLVYAGIFFYSLWFWANKGATPGKQVMGLRVQHKDTGANLTYGQGVLRLIGYVISWVFLLLGYLWVAFDARKQGWHDKIASSVVVRVD